LKLLSSSSYCRCLFLIIILLNSYVFKAQELDSDNIIISLTEMENYSIAQQKDSLITLRNKIATLNDSLAIEYFKVVDSLVKKPELKITFYNQWSIQKLNLGDDEKALTLRRRGIKMAKEVGDPYYEYGFLNGMATYFVNRSVADSATHYVTQMDALYKRYPKILAADYWLVFMRKARIAGILGNSKKEGSMLERAYQEKALQPIDSNLGFVLYMVTYFYREQNDPIKSSEYTELLVKHYEQRNINTPNAHFPIQSLLLGKYTPEAISSLKEVIHVSDSLKNYNSFSASNIALAKAYIENNNPEKAIPILKYGIEVLEKAKVFVNNSVEFNLLQQAYASTNDYEGAYRSILKQKKLEDSLRSAETLRNIADFEIKYKTQETELALEKKKAAQLKLYYLIAGAILLLVLISYFLAKNQRKNRLLITQKAQLVQALDEKETLLKEIHHRVKNNLQVISSLLSLQQRQLDDDTASKAIQIGRDRVKAMSLIHQNLYQEGNLVGVSVKDYIEKLAKSLVHNYQIDQTKIDLKLNIDPLQLDVDTIIPLGLIINELISNALKYAFHNKEQGSIHIELLAQKHQIYLSVKDNGVGLPHNFKSDETQSLGYRLIHAFSNKLNAVLNVKFSKNGTQVALTIPQLKKAS